MKIYLADTIQARQVARDAFVRVTGCSFDYREAWTDKDESSYGKYFRRIGIHAPYGKAEQIVEVMKEIAYRRGLAILKLRATPAGYVRFKAIFQPDVDKVFQQKVL